MGKLLQEVLKKMDWKTRSCYGREENKLENYFWGRAKKGSKILLRG